MPAIADISGQRMTATCTAIGETGCRAWDCPEYRWGVYTGPDKKPVKVGETWTLVLVRIDPCCLVWRVE